MCLYQYRPFAGGVFDSAVDSAFVAASASGGVAAALVAAAAIKTHLPQQQTLNKGFFPIRHQPELLHSGRSARNLLLCTSSVHLFIQSSLLSLAGFGTVNYKCVSCTGSARH